MELEALPETNSRDKPQPVSTRFVLCVIFGLYLVGYGAFRLRGEPCEYANYDDTPKQHIDSIRWLWESDEDALYKAFSTFYWPCLMAEDWLIHEVLW